MPIIETQAQARMVADNIAAKEAMEAELGRLEKEVARLYAEEQISESHKQILEDLIDDKIGKVKKEAENLSDAFNDWAFREEYGSRARASMGGAG